MVRIMIVHQSPIVRQGLRSLLQSVEDFQIVGEAYQQELMLLLIRETCPDVVLFDGGLSYEFSNSAVELVAHIYRAGVRGIFILAPSDGPVDEEQFFQFVKCGAVAYEPSNITGRDLIEKVRRVSCGESLISSALLLPIFTQYYRAKPGKALAPRHPQEPVWEVPETQVQSGTDFQLSKRELEVLREVMRGRNNRQIAAILQISDQTVKNHMATIRQKMRRPDRTSAVVLALRLNLLSLEDYQCTCQSRVVEQQKGSQKP